MALFNLISGANRAKDSLLVRKLINQQQQQQYRHVIYCNNNNIIDINVLMYIIMENSVIFTSFVDIEQMVITKVNKYKLSMKC